MELSFCPYRCSGSSPVMVPICAHRRRGSGCNMMVLGHSVGVVQGAEQLLDFAAAGGGVDWYVKAGVGTQQAVHLAVHAAAIVVMDLHGNAQTVVLLAEMD